MSPVIYVLEPPPKCIREKHHPLVIGEKQLMLSGEPEVVVLEGGINKTSP